MWRVMPKLQSACRVIEEIFCEVHIDACIGDVCADIRAPASGETPTLMDIHVWRAGPTVAAQLKTVISCLLRLFEYLPVCHTAAPPTCQPASILFITVYLCLSISNKHFSCASLRAGVCDVVMSACLSGTVWQCVLGWLASDTWGCKTDVQAGDALHSRRLCLTLASTHWISLWGGESQGSQRRLILNNRCFVFEFNFTDSLLNTYQSWEKLFVKIFLTCNLYLLEYQYD